MKTPLYKKTKIPKNTSPFKNRIILTGIISLFVFIIPVFSPGDNLLPYSEEMLNASKIMKECISVIRTHFETSGKNFNNSTDPNQTGLIGPELSSITTTLGHIDAKRTTTNPDMAALIVHLLKKAGVESGDTIALGCSASFPALVTASLSAAKAMEVFPVIIISIGASSFGATDPDFNLLDIYLLLKNRIFDIKPAAITLGGEKDIGEGFEKEVKDSILKQIQNSGILFIYEPDLRKNVAERMKLYLGNYTSKGIKAFINTGGSYANFGTSPLVLNVKPGLNFNPELPTEEDRGVIFEMIAMNIPVIHLLYIKGLAVKYNLPWDPVPLPEVGESKLKDIESTGTLFRITGIVYIIILCVILFFPGKKRNDRK
ncbi:poly-gamma-glutamate system protein [candidate division KSB1 bacterium]